MDPILIARAFNEWMRRYTEAPETFQADFVAVKDYLADVKAGEEMPEYGVHQANYLLNLMDEIR